MRHRVIRALVLLVLCGVAGQTAYAQRGEESRDRERPTREQRQKARQEALAKMFGELQIPNEQQVLVAALLDTLQMEREKIMEDARNGPRDPEIFRMVRQQMEDLTAVFDVRLKETLGEEKFDLFVARREAEQAERGDRRGRRGNRGEGRGGRSGGGRGGN